MDSAEISNAPVFTKKRPKHQHVATRHLMLLFASPSDLSSHHAQRVVQETPVRLVASFRTPAAASACAESVRGSISQDEEMKKRGKKIDCFFCTSSEDKPNKINGVRSISSNSPSNVPPGLIVVENFLSAEEEAALVAALDSRPWDNSIRRRVQHYGHAFDYTSRAVHVGFSKVQPIPDELVALFSRLQREGGVPFEPDQVTVNEYEVGIGIKAHVDTHSAFADGIASLSLLSDVAFEMKRCADTVGKKEKKSNNNNNNNNNNEDGDEEGDDGDDDDDDDDENWFGLRCRARSLLVMTGESRYAWTHGISARKGDAFDGQWIPRSRRLSITFRRVMPRGWQCRCQWRYCCDAQSGVKVEEAPKMEKDGVLRFYERIADHFSRTRHTGWPRVVQFARDCEKGTLLLDVGCGNGRHLLPAREAGAVVFGCDLIRRFCEICHSERKLQTAVCDCLHLPYRSAVFDRVMCIAVIHHLASPERRLRAVQEVARVTALKGLCLVTAWAMEQGSESKREFNSQDVMVPWVLPAQYDPEAADKKSTSSATVDRYCHVFVKGELEELIGKLPNVQIVESYYDQSNWACIFKKVAL